MLSTHFCILLPKSNWSLLLSCGPAGLSVPARGGSLFPKTGYNPYLEVANKTNCTKYWLCLACLALLFLLESPLDIRCPKWLAEEGAPDEAAFCGMAMRASMRSAGA